MNRIFKVKWNAALKRFDVTSELARGKTKSSCVSLMPVNSGIKTSVKLIGAMIALLSMPVTAEDIELIAFDPAKPNETLIVNDQKTLISGGNGFSDIVSGKSGTLWMTFQQAIDANLLKGDGVKWLGELISLGNQVGIDYIDPVTHNKTTLLAYDNDQLKNTSNLNTLLPIKEKVGVNGQYVDRNLVSVESGGTLDVKVGSDSTSWYNDPANRLLAYMKASKDNPSFISSVFKAESSSAAAPAELNYNSKTIVNLGNINNNQISADRVDITSFPAGFNGTFNSEIGQWTVNSIDDLRKYNQGLIDAVKSGALNPELYKQEFLKAIQTKYKEVYVEYVDYKDDPIAADINPQRVSYLLGRGNGAAINIDENANIQSFSSTISVVNVQDGAVLNNFGALGSFSNSSAGNNVIRSVNATVNNHGVIDAATNPEMMNFIKDDDTTPIGMPSVQFGQVYGIVASNSVINNEGVINVAPRQQYAPNYAVHLSGSSVLNNSGAINLSAGKEPNSYFSPNKPTVGVEINDSSSMTNTGTLYVGRDRQGSPDEAVADIDIRNPGNVLVSVRGTGSFVNDEAGGKRGQLVIGSQTQGAFAVSATTAGSVVKNAGDILVNGAASGKGSEAPLQNVGIQALTGANNIVNALGGNIILNGINAVAMMSFSSTANTAVRNEGTIDVNKGIDSVTKTANYGLWAEGKNASAINAGTINLSGEGAIGAHARAGGTLVIADSGKMNFSGGKNQTGYYVFGAGAKIIDNSADAQEANTEGSTLYRIDGGADFDGGTVSSSKIIASGLGATGILVTSSGTDMSNLTSGNMAIDVTGEEATGVKVAGNATGMLSDQTVLNLSGKGSSAGIVDGAYTDIVGNITQVGKAVLTSLAHLTSANTTADAVGYIARNGGTLDHQGQIDFTAAGATGVLVDGGTLKNSGDIRVNGIAVDIQGLDSLVDNSGKVEATDGLAAFRVGKDAELNLGGTGTVNAGGSAHGILLDDGAVGLTVKDATIDMADGGTGNAIENKAEISGIQLNNTTINVGNGDGVRTAATLAATNSGTITVNGSGTGIYFGHADGSATTGDLDTSTSSELVINVNSAAGNGIVTHTSGNVKSGASVNVNDAAGGSALKVGGSTEHVEQSGKLTSKSLTSAVVDVANGNLASFINSGDIIANSAAQEAIRVTLGSDVIFTNAKGGNIQGRVALGDGNNTVTLEGGSTANDVITGSGHDNYHLNGIPDSDTGLFTSLQAGAGFDTLNLKDSQLVITDASKITGFEEVSLKNGSILTLDNTLLPLGDNQDDATGSQYKLDVTSTLALKQSADTQFASHIDGTGTIAASTGGHTFDFTANNASNTFTGTLALTDTTFALGNLNTQALTNASLLAGEGSRVAVEDGIQRVGGLAFNGGTVAFDTGTPGEQQAKGTIQTSGILDASGQGTVEINPGSVNNNHVLPPQTTSLLEQDEGELAIELAGSDGKVQGSGGNLALRDTNGNLISDSLSTNVIQDGTVVANATYDYRLTTGEASDGLYVSYGLTQLDLLTQGADALSLNASGKTGNAADMSAKLTGLGDLAIDTGATGVVSLSNMDNDYRGKTDVRSGTLLMNNNNVLGNTSELALATDTGFDMNGHSQTVGVLNTAAGSLADIHGGALTISNGGTVNGSLQGSGALNVEGGTLTVNGSNAAFAVKTTIASGADVQLDSTSGLGVGDIVNNGLLALKNAAGNLYNSLSGAGENAIVQNSDVTLLGDNSGFSGKFGVESGSSLTATRQQSFGTAAINNNGSLNLNSADSWMLENTITGSGELNQNGTGVVTLSQAAAQFTGDTHVNHGGLQLGSAANNVTLASGNLDIAQGGVAGGFGGTAGNVSNSGKLLLGNLSPTVQAVADAVAFTVGGNLNNSGEVTIGQPGNVAGNLLNVKGDYVGNGGHLTLNTALGNDNSITDKLVVEGNTHGSTKVSVNNAGGLGGNTVNGIEVIHVNGSSEGNFVQDGRIVAGAYDYSLVRGKDSNAANWYLTNELNGGGGGEGGDKGDKEEIIKVYRPESGAYASNMAAANTLFNTRLHDRLGETHYVDALTGEDKVTSMWLRNVGGHTRSTDSSGQMKTQANRYVMQMGGDIAQWSNNGADRYHLGVMAGYANQQSNSRNHLTGQKADGSIHGYSTGIYGTWLQDNDQKTGAYVDSWMQYSWFDNTVKGDSLAAESYKSKGITASVEGGYTWKIGEKNQRESYFVTPQAQITWMGVQANDIREQNGTRVSGVGDGNIQTRLGARAFIKGHSTLDDGKDREFEPFIEANWIHNTQEFGSQLNGVTVTQKGTRNIGELKVGVEGQINKNVNLWGNIGQQIGDKGYSDTSALVGLKINF